MSLLEENARKIAAASAERYAVGGKRILIAVAGPPGSGKSALAERAVAILNESTADTAALLPMDGFHFDDVVLETLGLRDRKGAIDTFDAHGLRHMLERLRANEDDDVTAVPVFDRAIEISRAGGRLISPKTGIIICEGNYLLMRQPPWDRLNHLFEITVFVDVSEEELRRRLTARWAGYGLTPDAIDRKVQGNDLLNAAAVIAGSLEPHLRLANG